METEYGILYKKINLQDDLFILLPQKIIKGYCYDDEFYFDATTTFITPSRLPKKKDTKYVISGVTTLEILQQHYDYYEDEIIPVEYYYEEEKENAIFVKIENGKVKTRKVDLHSLLNGQSIVTFDYSKDGETVTLNGIALREILDSSNLLEVKNTIEKYSQTRRIDQAKKMGVTEVQFINGNISSVSFEGKRQIVEEPKHKPQVKKDTPVPSDFTVKGLRAYLKERIIGHDQEIDEISTVLVTNYRAQKNDVIDSILIPGPTGVGKTATLEVAAEYLNIPFIFINTADLVPQGIVGINIGDYLDALVEQADGNVELAKKGLFIFDEFDKLATMELDTKQAVKKILLKVMEGKEVMIYRKNSGSVSFDTSRLSKVYLGAFSDLYQKDKGLGFGADLSPGDAEFSLERAYEKGYFDEETLTRIDQVIPYKDLTYQDRLDIILKSKLSIYLRKKARIERDYGVIVEGSEEFAKGVLEVLKAKEHGMRNVDRVIKSSLIYAIGELETNPNTYKRLVLTNETAKDKKRIILQ